MKAEELRIGNLVHIDLDSPSLQVHEIIAKDIFDIESGKEEADPIPLTEEWLIKFGFIWSDPFGCFVNKGYMIEKIGDLLLDRRYGVVIKYVHQLQNFYFMVKGIDLSL